jgi:hypothetical protein
MIAWLAVPLSFLALWLPAGTLSPGVPSEPRIGAVVGLFPEAGSGKSEMPLWFGNNKQPGEDGDSPKPSPWHSLFGNSGSNCLAASLASENRPPGGKVMTAAGAFLGREGLQVPVGGPLLIFGHVTGGVEAVAVPDAQMIGDTGLACRVPLRDCSELRFCCGPQVSYLEPSRPGHTAEGLLSPVRTQWLHLQLQWRWLLLRQVGLECQSGACPALNPSEHDLISQDMRLVFLLGKAGEFAVGGGCYWENGADGKVGTEGTQFFGGLRLAW